MNWETLLERFATENIISVPVNSRAIERLEYDTEDETMTVTFTDGATYDYPRITPHQFLEFSNADSKGQFFNAYVRGQWG